MAVQPWKRIEPTIHTKVDYRNIIIKTFVMPASGETKTFATWLSEGGQSVGVIALTKDKQVIIAKQYRPGPERILLEIPGGGVEEGEEPEAAARRELREETGYVPGSMELLGTSCRDAYTNGTWNYYLATDCEPTDGGQHLDHNEEVEIAFLPIKEFIAQAKADQMTDPMAVLLAYDRLHELDNS